MIFIVLFELLVSHNIQLRCYSNTFTCSTNNGVRSLAVGRHVICSRCGSPRLFFQLLPTWKRDQAHGTVPEYEPYLNRKAKQTSLVKFCCLNTELLPAKNSRNNMNRWMWPLLFGHPVVVSLRIRETTQTGDCTAVRARQHRFHGKAQTLKNRTYQNVVRVPRAVRQPLFIDTRA